jgi:hypothetical protein
MHRTYIPRLCLVESHHPPPACWIEPAQCFGAGLKIFTFFFFLVFRDGAKSAATLVVARSLTDMMQKDALFTIELILGGK